jgi:hypothetical protein
MEMLNNKYGIALGFSNVDKTGGGNSDIWCLKNYNLAEIYVMTGAAVTTGTVTMQQGVSVSSVATALTFTRYFEVGCKLKYDGASSEIPAAAGEIVTGATNTALGTVYQDLNGELILYNRTNNLVYVDNEVLTFNGGKTAVANGALYDEDIMIPRTCASTFTITTAIDINKVYMIPIHASMLNQAAGMDCIEAVFTTFAGAAVMTCFAILSGPHFAGTPMPSALYN